MDRYPATGNVLDIRVEYRISQGKNKAGSKESKLVCGEIINQISRLGDEITVLPGGEQVLGDIGN